MAIEFYKLKVAKIIKETPDTVTIVFDIPKELNEVFHYKPGQYVTIKLPDGDPSDRRAYSISSSPYWDEPLGITVKKLPEGKLSVYLNENLQVGDYLDVIPPIGNFVLDFENKPDANYVLYAAGSGITPIFSILKSILKVQPKAQILLLYSNRTEQSIIFYDKLRTLEKNHENLKIIFGLTQYNSSWQGHRGRFNTINLTAILQRNALDFRNREHFLCGPAGMMKQVLDALELLNVERSQIHKESFTAEETNHHHIVHKHLPELIKRKVKVKLYGETFEIEVEPEDSLVSALQKQGYMPPYSCQIGACSTCRAKAISGKFYMDICEALSPEEIQAGYVLTCRAHPLEDNCFVDYD
jgi:ring-1,2-phenylacetyl-CoA epoxidase subunit PaaE